VKGLRDSRQTAMMILECVVIGTSYIVMIDHQSLLYNICCASVKNTVHGQCAQTTQNLVIDQYCRISVSTIAAS
jgi:hypothetical protein